MEEINGEKKRGLGAGNERMNNVEKKKHYRPHSEAVHAEVAPLRFPLSRALETTLEQTIISDPERSE